ncbi:MAG: thrombospondin type 3 repeat-containing protein, partial [Patescibacteria group bacterium]|nr:thrombospondin type 3 repeat-containing protein [Patescibacteria group bacterium]
MKILVVNNLQGKNSKLYWCLLFCIGLWLIVFFTNTLTFAQSNEKVNAGVVNGIWFSLFPFFSGDDVRIYCAIQNQSGFDIIGKLQFYNGDRLLGERDFSVINGHLVEGWIDWKAQEGEQELWVQIVEAKKSLPGRIPEPIILKFASTPRIKQFVDLDTDGDRIGNREDPDDDNDGLSDEEEKVLGT